jgi:hypothetical protein
MNKSFKNNGINILLKYILPPILIIITLIGLIIYNYLNKKYGNFQKFLILLVSFYTVTCLIPMPAKWFYKDHNTELDKNNIWIKGTWTTVYKPKNDKIIKQISAPGVSHKNFNHVALPTPFRMCERDSCTLVTMLAHRLSTRFMLLSLNRIKKMNSKFFPKIYKIDKKKRQIVQEYVDYEVNKNTCPANFEEQLKEFNKELEEHGYYVDDVHSLNWRVNKEGQLKVIDGELYTKKELDIQQSLLNSIDGSQDGIAKGHKNANRILHWQDGRPNIEDVCYKK